MKNTKTLEVARLRGASVIKLIVLGSVIGYTLMASVFGIAALFGVQVIQWNDQYVTGIKGLLGSPFIGAFIGLIFGLFSAAFSYVGLRCYALFRSLSIEYVPTDNQNKPSDNSPVN